MKLFWSSPRRYSRKKAFLKNFAKFTGKDLCHNFVKKRLWHRSFPVNFAKFLRTLFKEHLRLTAFVYFQTNFKNSRSIESYNWPAFFLLDRLSFYWIGASSIMRQFLATESPWKMMKNVFYFTLKAITVLKIFKFLSWLFGYVEKWLE